MWGKREGREGWEEGIETHKGQRAKGEYSSLVRDVMCHRRNRSRNIVVTLDIAEGQIIRRQIVGRKRENACAAKRPYIGLLNAQFDCE